MSGITKEMAQEHLNLWLEAEKAVATGQSYTIGRRSLTRPDLSEIRRQIAFWRGEIARIEGKKITRVVPRDL